MLWPSSDELEQRVGEALRARTYGDLAELLADLPGDGRVAFAVSQATFNQWRCGAPVARAAVLGSGLLVAVTVALALVAVVAVLVLTAAAWWIALVLFSLLCCGSRRRLGWGRARPQSLGARQTQHARPTALR